MSYCNPAGRRSLLPKPSQVQSKQSQTGSNNTMDKAKEQKLPLYQINKTKSTTTITTEDEIIHVQNKYIDILGININDFYNPTFAQNDQREKKPTDKKFKKTATVLPKRASIVKKKSNIFRGETFTNISERKLKNLFNKETVEKINWRERKALKGNAKIVVKKDPPKLYSVTYSLVQMPALQTAVLEPACRKEPLLLYNLKDLIMPSLRMISEIVDVNATMILQRALRELRACAVRRKLNYKVGALAVALPTDNGNIMFTRILINMPITFIFVCGFLAFALIYTLYGRIQ